MAWPYDPPDITWPAGFTPPPYTPPEFNWAGVNAATAAFKNDPTSFGRKGALGPIYAAIKAALQQRATSRQDYGTNWMQQAGLGYNIWNTQQQNQLTAAALQREYDLQQQAMEQARAFQEAQEARELMRIAEEKRQRLAALKADPRQWIEYSKQAGEALPNAPRWLSDILLGRGAGQQISQGGPAPATFARQLFDQLSPSMREALLGYLDYLGMPAEDWLRQMQQSWTGGTQMGRTAWSPAGRR